MEQIKIPDGYQSALNLHDTQIAIKTVKDFFQQTLSQNQRMWIQEDHNQLVH